MNGYTVVNPYLSYRLTSNINLSLNGNNVFDALGITEAEEGSIPANNIVRARPIQGRSISMSIKLDL
jgi:outer membrane receptor for ferric coprogen and ferric-rhodotorulic acid